MDLCVARVVRKWGAGAALLLSGVASLGMAVSAKAASRDFEIRWSSFGTAIAMGTMTIDDAVFLNPGSNSTMSIPWVTAFSVTITGASSGNGTFTLSDFSEIALDTNGGTLDLSRPLLGQNDGGLFDPVGRNGAGGDFNVFSSGPAPKTVDGLADPTGSSGCLVDSIDAQVDHTLFEEYGL
jgi:hypothetical protein